MTALQGRPVAWTRLPAALAMAAAAAFLGCRGGAEEPVHSAGPAPAAAELAFEWVVDGNQDIYAIPASGGVSRRLTDDPALDGLPRWTPDGATVVFCSERTGHYQLFEVAATGGPARPVRANTHVEYQADVSPDGRSLAFLSNAEGAEHLWVLERASGSARVLVRHGRNSILGNPDWSPEGQRLVYSSNWRFGHQIYVFDVKTAKENRISPMTSGGCEPRFHPDGKRVVYVSRRHLGDTSRLVEHDLASGEEKVLVDWPALNYDPTYSHDGSEIAFASNITGEFAVYRQRLADGQSWRVTFGKGSARYPDYRPAAR
jgi:Tol biopolymer transport system component